MTIRAQQPTVEKRTTHSLSMDLSNVAISASSEDNFALVTIQTGLSTIAIDRHRMAALAAGLKALDVAITETQKDLE